MRKSVAILLSILAVGGCERMDSSVDPAALGPMDRDAAVADALRYLGDGARLSAICGPSKGAVLFLDHQGAKFEADGISDGVIALGFDANQKPDVVHRDALKKMVRVSEDSANVTFVAQPNHPDLGTWNIIFSTTGIVETHSLVKTPKGELFDLWTSTRSYGLASPRSLAFLSKCESL